MTDGARMRVSRDRAFSRLRRARPHVTGELIKAVLKNADEHAALSRGLVPVDEGDLRDSIESNLIEGGVNPRSQVEAGPDDLPEIARWTEFGTAGHVQGGIFAGSIHPGTTAQPFMFPAYRLLKKRAISRMARAITKGIKRGIR